MGATIAFVNMTINIKVFSNYHTSRDLIMTQNLQQASFVRRFHVKAGNSKIKTRKACSKRFKLTGNGKILRRQSAKQHLNEKKSPARKRKLSSYLWVSSSDLSHV